MNLKQLTRLCVSHISLTRPRSRVEIIGDGTILVDGVTIDLNRLLEIVNIPAKKSGVPLLTIQTQLEKMLDEGEFDLVKGDYDLLKTGLRLMARPTSVIESLDEAGLIHFTCVPGVLAVLELELTQTIRNVSPKMLLDLNINPGEARITALDNLARKLIPAHFEAKKIDGKIVALESSDRNTFTASRILLPNLYTQFESLFGGEFFVAVPCRNQFFAFSGYSEEVFGKMGRLVQGICEKSEHPVTDKIFLVRGCGISGLAALPI